MDKLQEINEYTRNIKIKKCFFGGYDKEDVYDKLTELTEMFKACVTELQEKEKAQIESYEQRIHSAEMLIAELNKKIGALSAEQRTADLEKEKMKSAYKEYCTNILHQYSDSLCKLSTEFTQILGNISDLQKNIEQIENIGLFEVEAEETPMISEVEEIIEHGDAEGER